MREVPTHDADASSHLLHRYRRPGADRRAAARALEEQRGEEAAIKACDQRLCSILVHKNAKGEDPKCTLTKTWAKSKIKEADTHKLSWG